jgi:cytochrome c oxidase assembly factor CtaG
MIIEIVILLEIIAFVMLILSLLPYNLQDSNNERSTPYLNKIIFILVAMVLFSILGIISVQYQYTYCYINETSWDLISNSSLSSATCADYQIENIGLAYLNWGMVFVCLVLAIVMWLLMLQMGKEKRNREFT